MTEYTLETLLEATLFAAGKSMKVFELSEIFEKTEEEINESLSNLANSLKRRRGSALQLVEIGGRWALEVKPKIGEHLPSKTRTDIPVRLLRAAALIAYHQPMRQARLVELVGQRAYEDVSKLSQIGLIDRRKEGSSRRLTTTRRFSELFNCPHTERKKVKKWFREQAVSLGFTEGGDLPMALTPSEEDAQTELDIDTE